MNLNGTVVYSSVNTRVSYSPLNYVGGPFLQQHLQGIDAKLSGSSAPPLHIFAGTTYTVYQNTQVLTVLPIDIDGELVIDGAFFQIGL